MFNTIKYYDNGFNVGLYLAIKDKLLNIKRKFIIIKTNSFKSKIYNTGIIDGYTITYEKLTLII